MAPFNRMLLSAISTRFTEPIRDSTESNPRSGTPIAIELHFHVFNRSTQTFDDLFAVVHIRDAASDSRKTFLGGRKLLIEFRQQSY